MFSVLQIDFAGREFAWSVVGGFLLALISYRFGPHMSQLRRRASVNMFVTVVAGSAAMLAIQCLVATRFGWPVPAIHDEFSYLLTADTFASGRVTNPTHPAWEFFETYHVLWQPTYQSKYPPGNGLALAIGQILTGRPIVGMWLCLATAVGGAFWMLRGWFSIRWAVIGTVILMANWPLTKLWGQTFFGGGPALLGGVLVYGALPRLIRKADVPSAIVMGIGLNIWAITRPYEGLVACLPMSMLLAVHAVRLPTNARREWLARVALPLMVVAISGLCTLSWYHLQVTGSPWKWPYRLYEETYTKRVSSLNTLFAWTELGPRQRTIPSLEYESSAGVLRIAETKPAIYALWKALRLWWFQLGLIWTLPFLIAVYYVLRQRSRLRGPLAIALLTMGLVTAAILLQRSAGLPHYAAPIMPLSVIVIVQGLRLLQTLTFANFKIGRIIVLWMVSTSVLFFILPILTGVARPNVRPWSLERQRILQELESHRRPSLVIVKYGLKHSMHEEWVYNRADIQRAHVVWARDLGESRLPELPRQFPDRDVWIVEPDTKPMELRRR